MTDTSEFRVLVCGDRRWYGRKLIGEALEAWREHAHLEERNLVVIDGYARGADMAAHIWAEHNKIKHLCFPAQWNKFGRAAGVIRNQQMLDEGKPDIVLAFHNDLDNSRGTQNMVRKAAKQGVEFIHFVAPDKITLTECADNGTQSKCLTCKELDNIDSMW